jgi:hypothetical protein
MGLRSLECLIYEVRKDVIMASFGSVFKNGLIFIIISAPFLYLGALLMVFALDTVLSSYGGLTYEAGSHDDAKIWLFLGMLAAFGGGGMMYLKALSDTVEEGLDY